MNYKQEIIPKFNEDDFKKFISQLDRNIISKKVLETFDKKQVKLYYNLGLIGSVEKVYGNGKCKYIQSFLPSSKYTYNDSTNIPESDYYFTHPSIDKSLISSNGINDFYDGFNIIGDGYPFYTKEKESKLLTDKQYYYPKVPGDRWGNISTTTIKLAIGKYYEEFYSSSKEEVIKLRNYTSESNAVLNCLGEARCLILLENNEKGIELIEQIHKGGIITSSDSVLKSELTTSTLKDFSKRLSKRLVVLGAYLYLNYSIEQIWAILTNVKLDNTSTLADSKYRYIIERYFICELKKNNSHNKEEIYNSISEHEKKMLNNWNSEFHGKLQTFESLKNEDIEILKEKLRK